MTRIFVVEDDTELATRIAAFLTGAGYDCVTFGSGGAVLCALLEGPAPAALLCDVGLPDVSGFTVEATASRIVPGLPVLLMSGKIGPESRAPGPTTPTGVLLKPLVGADLLTRLRDLGIEGADVITS